MLKLLKEILRGKSFSRTLTNIELGNFEIDGEVLDVGGQRQESHYRFIKDKGAVIKTVNINNDFKPDFIANIEMDKLPVSDNSQKVILCFNVLEHIFSDENLLFEVNRALKAGGVFLGSVPFLVNVHPDPNDFRRITGQFLQKNLKEKGFKNIKIIPIGLGPYAAAYSQIEFTLPVFLRPIFLLPAIGLDYLINKIKPKANLAEKFALAYVFYAEK